MSCGGSKYFPAVLVSLSMLLTGCTAVTGAEGLLRPPRLSEEQSAVSEALYAKVGKDIKLKYPRSGEQRGAILVEDLDGDGLKEAVAFYEKRTGGGVRMNLLYQQNGRWLSLYDYAGAGGELEVLMVDTLSDTMEKTLMVGYSLLGQGHKVLNVYSYKDTQLVTLQETSYAELAVTDINADGRNELVILDTSASMTPSQSQNSSFQLPKARMYQQSKSGELQLLSQTDMDETVTEYTSITVGSVSSGIPGIYADGLQNNGNIQTQLLYCVEGQIKNPLYLNIQELQKTTRPISYKPIDVDMDGVTEIPVPTLAPGYEALTDAVESQRVYLTDWMAYDRFGLTRKSQGYYSPGEGFCFLLPGRWQGAVTVKVSAARDEAIFYKYEGSLEASTKELLIVKAVSKGESTPLLEQGWQLFAEGGGLSQNDYLYKQPGDGSEPLELTEMEIDFNFYVI